MRKQSITSTVIFVCLSTLVATTVNAQGSRRFEVNIPFQFFSNGRTLPAGKYVVERIDSTKQNVVMLKNKDEGTVLLILTQRVEQEQVSESSSLVFLRRNAKNYLFEIWAIGDSSGSRIPFTNDKRQDRRNQNSALVRVRANGTQTCQIKSMN